MKVVAKEIECIVVFDKGDLPKPIRFRYRDSKEKEHVIHIHKVQEVEKTRKAGIDALVYTCCTDEKVYELKFELHTCQWVLFRV